MVTVCDNGANRQGFAGDWKSPTKGVDAALLRDLGVSTITTQRCGSPNNYEIPEEAVQSGRTKRAGGAGRGGSLQELQSATPRMLHELMPDRPTTPTLQIHEMCSIWHHCVGARKPDPASSPDAACRRTFRR